MSTAAIWAEGIGKRYRIGAREQSYRTIRETVSGWAQAPARAWRSWRRGGARAPESIWALRDLSLEIAPGEVAGLIGGNGSGKSTLLKILSRITEPTCGLAEVRGRVGALLEVGAGFHPELNGRENIYLNAAILGLSRAETARRFGAIVEFSGVERFLDVPVKRYSSGMYTRLAFSVAAHLEPDILLVDEVLAVGDAAFQKKCLDKLKSLTRDSGRTVVFVSHDMHAVRTLCKTAIHLEHGRVVDRGPAPQVIARYQEKLSARRDARTWEEGAPGDGEVTLRAIEVRPRLGQGPCRGDDEIVIALSFEAKIVRRGLCIGFDLATDEGITVFRSYQTDLAEQRAPTVKPGWNRFECAIPPGLLNAGVYYVCPRLSVHNSYWIVNGEAAVQFEVQRAGRRGTGTVGRAGAAPGVEGGFLSELAMPVKAVLKQYTPVPMYEGLAAIKQKVHAGITRRALGYLRGRGYNIARASDYYSPLPSVAELARRRERWCKPSPLSGLRYDLEAMKARLAELVERYREEWLALPSYSEIAALGFGPGYTEIDAMLLYMTLRDLKPARYIEVGSGVSTYYCSLAAKANRAEGRPLEIECIEPYPHAALYRIPDIRVYPKVVQEVDGEIFAALEAGDVLFIDSSHILRLDGDVALLILEVLPMLKAGVNVHIHDIPFPYNIPYPPDLWVFGREWPMFWNEAMVVQAFLCFNPKFEITLSPPLIRHWDEDLLKRSIPGYKGVAEEPNTFSSLWLRVH